MTDELKILIVDDDEVDRMSVRRALGKSGMEARIEEAATCNEALAALREGHFDCALFDYLLPDGDGLSLLRDIRAADITTPVVMLTGQRDERLIVELLRAGAADYLSKGELNAENLGHATQTAIRLHHAEQERLRAHDELERTHDELKASHAQLLQSEKLASIGQLAAGVAHEINNPVGYVYSNLGTLQKYIDNLCQILEGYEQLETLVDADQEALKKVQTLKQELDLEYLKEDLRDLVSESREGISRVKNIVQDLKDFSHVDEAEWQWTNLHHGLDSTLNIVNNEIKYKAEVVKEYGELPEVECLASQINQVFMNLLVNAAHAIEEHGLITIRSGQDDDAVWVSITDTGKGIEPDNMKKIFDPFFTTKAVGMGTGLGLSLSYGIVHKHGGEIEVDSEVGKGTTFTVHLPVKQPEAQAKNTEASA
ncbi:MAG: ATP-binding protein [Gammaproteobacteria bacterium]|nr:ATP-binding protein [Gammaproteobacteria bacterium]MCF6337212.1 ATP-binding protein [Gammaproteobacteria bacterium]